MTAASTRGFRVPNDHTRKALHAYVTDQAHERWHGFAAEQGVSVSAILEALATALDPEATPTDASCVELTHVVVEARRIDAKRRRRRRN